MIEWDVYEISSEKHSLVSVKCRGRIRKVAVLNGIDLLTENATDVPGNVRFAIRAGTSPEPIVTMLKKLFNDIEVKKIDTLVNPILSKMKLNILDRYVLPE